MSLTFTEENSVGFVEFNQPDSKVNVLSAETLKKLDELLERLKTKTNLKAIVFTSAKKDIFIAGADIKEIEKITEPGDGALKAKAGQDVFNKLEDLVFPTVAVIDGAALGGGCEFALACRFRLATFNDKVKIGLPEVNLGFIPGFGGTYRLPRLIGLSEGLKMILAGKPVDGAKALRSGLVDGLIPQVGLKEHVLKFISKLPSTLPPKFSPKKLKGLQAFLEGTSLGHLIIFKESRKSVLANTKGFYPSPMKAIEVIERNFSMKRTQALELEAKAFGELAVTDISKNLVHVFYLSEKFKKLMPEGAEEIRPKEIKKCAVLGAGVMGGGIAQLTSTNGIWTRLKDINYDAIGKGFKAAYKIYQSAVKSRRLSKAEAEERMAHITGTLDYSGMQGVDLVIEAVVEKMEVKKKVFEELGEKINDTAILGTNTSALSVIEMAKATKNPSRVIGIHFFNPVHRMPLVEVITTPMTSTQTIVSTLNLIKRLGKTPILVKDSCGFIVNRILLLYINEAGRILDEYGEMERIDNLVVDFGLPMGPFTLSDEVGLDVGIKVLHVLQEGLGERFKPADIFEKVAQKGLLGKKGGKGYYIHDKKRLANPEINQLISPKSHDFKPEEFLNRMILGMVNEAAMCLEEGIVTDPGSIDIGMIFGTGFPPFRGGLLKYADSFGIEKLVSELERLEKTLNAPRFKPCRYLCDLRDKNRKFYSS